LTDAISHAEANFDSVLGRMAAAWRITDVGFEVESTVPPGVTGTVHLPRVNPEAVTESGRPLGETPGITSIREADDHLEVEIASGTYRFLVPVATAG
jgi:alpha-L-rhamnosidase